MENTAPMGLRLSLLSRAVRKQVDGAIRDAGLTGVQLFALSELRKLECSGAAEVNQKDLEAATRVTHPTMTSMLHRLEKKGYVACRRSEQDRRFKCVASTEKALGLRQRLEEADAKAFQALCEGLGEEETAQLRAITGRMMENAVRILEKGCENGCAQNACRQPAGE